MIRLLVFIVIGFSLLFILSEIIKYLSAINGTKRQIQKDKGEFISRLKSFELESWPWEDLSTLSQNFELNYSTKVLNSIYEGIYTSIYQEDIGNIIAKQYGDKYLILIRTLDDIYELVFDEKGKSELNIEGGETYNFTLTESKLQVKSLDISIQLEVDKPFASILFGGKEIIKVNPLESKNKSLERLIALNPDPENIEVEKIVKFLLLFYLIWQELMD